MADIVVQAVIRKAVDIGSNLVIQKVSRSSKVRQDMEWIETAMTYLQSYLKDADSRQRGDSRVVALVSEIRRLGSDVQQILDTYFPKLVQSRKKGLGIFSYKLTASSFSARIDDIKRRKEQIDSRLDTIYGINESGHEKLSRQTFSHVDDPNVVGFEGHVNTLVARMLDKDTGFDVISITGMPGLGKTTLAMKVYKSVKSSFDCAAWIFVSRQPEVADLLLNIASEVGLPGEKREQGLEANLYKFLSDRTYLIVIDDIWETGPWNSLRNGIPTNVENGSRIILTSRNKAVLQGIHVGGENFLYELQPLGTENSKKLWNKTIKGDLPEELEGICAEILKRCGGVPLAIVLTAGTLLGKEKTEHEWKRVLQSMGEKDDECLKILALSYKDLPFWLKPCFLYLGLFPVDYEISAFDLVNFWSAEGFIRGREKREVEEVGEDCLNDLIARNLVQVAKVKSNGRIRSVRLHDLIHNLCVQEAKDYGFFDKLATGELATRMPRITTYFSNDSECTYFIDNFSSQNENENNRDAMLCFGNNEGDIELESNLENFLRDLRFLRVLSLDFEIRHSCEPSEIGYLSRLACIRLRLKNSFTELPSSISNLSCLLTLDARQCYQLIIPCSIWKMKQLRHILLPKVTIIKYNNRRYVQMGKFEPIAPVNLQTLYALSVERLPAKYWFPKFTSLRKLGVYFEPFGGLSKVKVLLDAITEPAKLEILKLKANNRHIKYNMVDLNLCRFKNLSNLRLYGMLLKLPQHDKLPQNLTKLTLSLTKLKEDPMNTLKKLPKLMILKFRGQSYDGKTILVRSRGPNDNFPRLQVLVLENLFHLKEFIVEEEEEFIAMPRLKTLRITDCYELQNHGEIRISDRIKAVKIITTNRGEKKSIY